MNIELKFGKKTLTAELNQNNYMGSLHPNVVGSEFHGKDEVIRSLENPIHSNRLKDIVQENEKIAIITSDITRPMPSAVVLHPVIDEIRRGGVKDSDIMIVLALGSHRKHTEDEKRVLVGEIIYNSEIQVIDSDMEQVVNFGTSKNGTPIDVFAPVANADRRICLGNIEYHYFAGYSGGAKAIMPGVSSHKAIQANHANMVKPEARAGNLLTNPVRQDIDEVGKYVGIDFIVNVVLNENKEIVKAVSGHYIEAHRNGCQYLDSLYMVKIKKMADIVVVSPGGFPKDINLYQSQKALDNSRHAVREGGIIILTASAKEKFGQKHFEEWMLTKTPDEMIEEIEQNFILGGHKAAAIAMILKRNKIFLVSDLEDELVRKINFIPFDTLQEAVDAAVEEMGANSQVLILPAAGSTLPFREGSNQ